MKLGSETGSLTNHLISRMTLNEPEPYVGMPATLLGWTDRHPATVVEVNTKKRYIVVQEDDAIRTDSNGMSESQEYEYTRNPAAARIIYRKNKAGLWKAHYINLETNRLVQKGSYGLRLGDREKYHDFSF